jgi:hypothetical protein
VESGQLQFCLFQQPQRRRLPRRLQESRLRVAAVAATLPTWTYAQSATVDTVTDGAHRFHGGVRLPLRRSTGASATSLATAAVAATSSAAQATSKAASATTQPATECATLRANGLRLPRSMQCAILCGQCRPTRELWKRWALR